MACSLIDHSCCKRLSKLPFRWRYVTLTEASSPLLCHFIPPKQVSSPGSPCCSIGQARYTPLCHCLIKVTQQTSVLSYLNTLCCTWFLSKCTTHKLVDQTRPAVLDGTQCQIETCGASTIMMESCCLHADSVKPLSPHLVVQTAHPSCGTNGSPKQHKDHPGSSQPSAGHDITYGLTATAKVGPQQFPLPSDH